MTLVAFSARAGSRISRLSALFGGASVAPRSAASVRTVAIGMSRGAFSCSSSSAASITGSLWKRSRMRPSKIDVGDRHHRHALMVRHVVEDDGVVGAFRHALRREVDGVVEAVVAERADRAQPVEIGRPPRAA